MNTPARTSPPPTSSSPAEDEKATIFLGILEAFRQSASPVAVKTWCYLLRDFSATEIRAIVPKLAERKGLPDNLGALVLEMCKKQRDKPDVELDQRAYPQGARRFPPHYSCTVTTREDDVERVELGRFGGYGCGPSFPEHQQGVYEWNGPDAAATARKVWSP